MFKTIVTLCRGRQAEATEALADANALTLLDQHIRDASADLERARRALAIATAQDAGEAARAVDLRGKIADLEARALAALEGGAEDLADEATAAIAALENDLEGATTARENFARETGRLRAATADAEKRFLDLERGRRAARAGEAVRRLRSRGADNSSALRDAEATLKRLRERQSEDEAVNSALEAQAAPCIAEKLEAAGFGAATRFTARSVLERLKQKRQTS